MKKRNLFALILALIVCLAFALAGCNNTPDNTNNGNTENGNGNQDNHTYYTVTFDSKGGSSVESQRIMEGNPVRRPDLPIYAGYNFNGWYKDEATTDDLWNFDTDRVQSDLTLYAGWQPIPDEDDPTAPATASLVFEREGDTYIVKGVGEETAIVIPAEHDGLPVVALRGDYGNGAFARKDIVSVVIPDSVTEIGQNTFNGCTELVSVKIGENSTLAKIGNNAFSGCSSLKQIYLPATITEIGNSVFNNCGALENITVAQGNTAYRSENGHLIESATDTLIRGGINGNIPSGVKIIGQAAFRKGGVTQISIPATVTEIGKYAFDDCEKLTAITVDNANANYAAQDGILYNNAKTALVKVPEGITGSVTLPATLAELPMYAFDGLTKLTEVTVPNGALNSGIRFAAFRGSGVTKVNYGGTESDWEQIIAKSHAQWNMGVLAAFAVICTTPEPTPDPTPEPTKSKILIAYFSATNNTENIAKHIEDITGGTMYEILPKVPYTSADLNYNTDCRANREQNNPDCRPEIDGSVADMASYDVVFIGYPIWWGQAPKILYTFLESYEFAGKTIIPFCTSGSSGIGSSATNLSSSASDATWLSGQRFSGSASKTTVETWINGLNLSIQKEQEMKISVKSGDIEIVYQLNDSKAAKDLYAQLPLTITVEPYSNNEIIFYPEALDTSDAPLAEGGAGSLAYYAPWGDVVLFYGSFNKNSSLFELGKIISGVENINKLSGTVTITTC